MIKKTLLLASIGGIGYAIYRYFNKQLFLAKDFDIKVADAKVNTIDKNGANIDLVISILNKSSFAIEVLNYDIDVIFDKKVVGNVKHAIPFIAESNNWFNVSTNAYIDFGSVINSLDDIGMAILKNKPLKIDLKGEMNVKFRGLDKKVIFNKKDILLSEELTSDLGLNKPVDKITGFLGDLGIKL